MSLALLAETMNAAGKKYSMNVRDLRTLCVKMVVLSMRYADRRRMWDALFPDDFVDWDLVQRGGFNMLGDLHVWVPLLELFTWEGLERAESAPNTSLAVLRRATRAHGMDVGTWTLPCQLHIAQLLHGIPVLQVWQVLTCRALKRDTHTQCALLLAGLSDNQFMPAEYEESLRLILGKGLVIDVSKLEEHLRNASMRRADLSEAFKLKSLSSYHGRPRLRDRACATEEQKVQLDVTLGTWESYVGFCQLHQFPNVLSDNVKKRLYFLASQSQWEWRPFVGHVMRYEGGLCERIGKYPVSRPDLPILYQVIDGLCMDGTPPFEEMTAFKNQCFGSFPVSSFQRMTLTQVLKLYVCAYQNPVFWKELWKQQLCLISPQIIKDCEAFVEAHLFAGEAFMALMCSA